MKLNRLLAAYRSAGRKVAHGWIAAGHVRVDGEVVTNSQHEVDRFMKIELDHECVQKPQRALYLMMHKPAGYLSATCDPQHPTVLDLIDDEDKHTLHLAGRLDRASTGMLLLSNDGRWTKRLMDPEGKVPKSYLVTTAEPIAEHAIEAFAAGFYFHTEALHTKPAILQILHTHQARVILQEGRYHQIKRMFHRINNRVLSLHRESIGSLPLPVDLEPGQWRPLNAEQRELALMPPV